MALRHRAQSHQQFAAQTGREPSHRAEPLEEISESHAPEPLPAEQTISNEEAGDSLALARKDSRNLPRAAGSVLSRTSIHRSRRAKSGIERRRRETTAFARAKIVARRSPRVRRRRAGKNFAGKNFYAGRDCGFAVGGHFRQSGDGWRRPCQRRRSGERMSRRSGRWAVCLRCLAALSFLSKRMWTTPNRRANGSSCFKD